MRAVQMGDVKGSSEAKVSECELDFVDAFENVWKVKEADCDACLTCKRSIKGHPIVKTDQFRRFWYRHIRGREMAYWNGSRIVTRRSADSVAPPGHRIAVLWADSLKPVQLSEEAWKDGDKAELVFQLVPDGSSLCSIQ